MEESSYEIRAPLSKSLYQQDYTFLVQIQVLLFFLLLSFNMFFQYQNFMRKFKTIALYPRSTSCLNLKKTRQSNRLLSPFLLLMIHLYQYSPFECGCWGLFLVSCCHFSTSFSGTGPSLCPSLLSLLRLQ